MRNTNILGVPFDGGISAMQHLERGVTGAADAPEAIIAALEERNFFEGDARSYINLPRVKDFNSVVTAENAHDHQFIVKQRANVYFAHRLIQGAARRACDNALLLSLGGDHSISKPLVSGVKQAHSDANLGVAYLDAHFDMRKPEWSHGVNVISSGNPFWRLLESEEVDASKMVALGIQRTNSDIFRTLSGYAESKGIRIIYHDEFIRDIGAAVREAIDIVCSETDGFYLSADTDIVHKDHAPGVSAPAENGISREQLLTALEQFKQAKDQMLAADVVEISSRKLKCKDLEPREDALDDPDFKKTVELGADMVEILAA